MSSRFRSKRKGFVKSDNAAAVVPTTTLTSNVFYTIVEDGVTLMSIRGNISITPVSAAGAIYVGIQVLRSGGTVVDLTQDSEGYTRYLRVWDEITSFKAAALETLIIDIVSKKRRKLWIGDQIVLVYVSTVANVGLLAWNVKAINFLHP